MRKKIRVVITGEDFVSSDYMDGRDCALAKALKREFPNSIISVGGSYAIIDKITYDIPKRHMTTIMTRCDNKIDKKLVVILTLE